ncbi:phage tail protein [Pantoea sp. Ap-967]|uniref:phage tail protein n=1 Tax=Pantoea sp. Ap-967 TaxID=2608362 RepID=UPI0014211240|nr:tail fiber protein [Pantoea sp. Ap-967]NIE74161.1 phage tail protein [Pantoea sp. Ap-967]
MSEPFIAEIKMFAGNFAPRGYALCNGQLLAVQQNQALTALIGNLYGGTLPTTIALPNFGGCTPVGQGTLTGSSSGFTVGQTGGVEAVTLTNGNLPFHNHILNANTAPGDHNTPTETSVLASPTDAAGSPLNMYAEGVPVDTQMALQAIGNSGQSLPLSVRNPYLSVSFIIALTGIYPTRD